MRRFIIAIAFVSVCALQGYSQEDTQEKFTPQHEIKLNIVYTLAEIVELNYELVLGEDFSVGLAANYWFDESARIDYQIIPNFRFYPLNQKPSAGFFIEANTSILGVTNEIYDFPNEVEEESDVEFGMGVATGYKFISRNDFTTELYIGAGRVFGEDYNQFYPRLGITLGKRF